MAKSCMIQREKKRKMLAKRFESKRSELKAKTRDRKLDDEERFAAQIALAALPRNSAPVRQHNRCRLTGRSHGYYRRFGVSRIKLRELASFGHLPGVIKASW